MAGIIALLKPGRCLRPRNKSYFLEVGATVHPEKNNANNQALHGNSSESTGRSINRWESTLGGCQLATGHEDLSSRRKTLAVVTILEQVTGVNRQGAT